jgi:uncharacterized protein (DUF488 family)
MNSPKTVPLATIGYEGAPLGEVLGRLSDAGISLLIDVRAVAASRRAGFSKTILASSLNEVGIDYLHLRNLGTPKDGRIAARSGRTKQMRAIFSAHMQTDPARAALDEAVAQSKGVRACLLCFEKDWGGCHRAIVADLIQAQTGAPILHL